MASRTPTKVTTPRSLHVFLPYRLLPTGTLVENVNACLPSPPIGERFRGSLHHFRRELLSRFGGEVVGRFSESEKAELWDRFEAGESLRAISRQLGRAPSSVRTHVVSAGWRRPVPAGDWCPIRLSFAEREQISRGLAAGVSLRSISRRLGRAPSTVSRGSRRQRGTYPVSGGGGASGFVASGPSAETGELVTHPQLRQVVEAKLELWWSPLQISGWLMETYPDDEEMRVSHETIYQSLFIQGEGRAA